MTELRTTDTTYFASWDQYKKWFGGRSRITIAAIFLLIIIATGGRIIILLPVVLILSILLYYIIRYKLLHNAVRITVTNEAIIYKGFFRTTTIQRDGNIEGFYGTYFTGNPWPLKTVLLANKVHRGRLQLNSGYWKVEVLQAVATAAGVPILADNDIKTTKGLRKEQPRLLPYYSSHPWKWGIALFFIIIVAIALLVIIVNVTK